MHRYYVCAVLPSEDAVLGPPAIPAKPQRAKVTDLLGYTGYAADIPTDPVTGLTLKSWCVISVEAADAQHQSLAADAEMWVIGTSNEERAAVRVFLAQNGEINPPDTPQACLTRLHPMSDHGHVPQIANLGVV